MKQNIIDFFVGSDNIYGMVGSLFALIFFTFHTAVDITRDTVGAFTYIGAGAVLFEIINIIVIYNKSLKSKV